MNDNWEQIEQILNKRISDAWELHEMHKMEQIPELKGVWEYQINLNFAIIEAILDNKLIIATAYTNEITRSTKAAMQYRQFITDNTQTR